ncbi:MAG TPA: DUF2953 domain-containing protein [Clostridium sp.]|uniref:DUF2953 domain-containing protein n=1 Tax=Clostridium sp. TaxID=1506 RepID=UPI002F951C05
MLKYTIVFILVITVILFPIPLKITLKYINKVLEIYIYNKGFMVKSPLKKTIKNTTKGVSIDPSKGNKIETFLRSLNLSDIKLIIHQTKSLKFKSTFSLNTKIEYGLDDAAMVAILYGLIHSTYSLLYLMLKSFVKVKEIDFKVIPHFEENDLYMEISSIIYINLAKVIYMAFKMLPCLVKIKHNKFNIKNYKGGDIHG